jgi:hypothetical protein
MNEASDMFIQLYVTKVTELWLSYDAASCAANPTFYGTRRFLPLPASPAARWFLAWLIFEPEEVIRSTKASVHIHGAISQKKTTFL